MEYNVILLEGVVSSELMEFANDLNVSEHESYGMLDYPSLDKMVPGRRMTMLSFAQYMTDKGYRKVK